MKRRSVRSTSYSNDFAYWNHSPKPVGPDPMYIQTFASGQYKDTWCSIASD